MPPTSPPILQHGPIEVFAFMKAPSTIVTFLPTQHGPQIIAFGRIVAPSSMRIAPLLVSSVTFGQIVADGLISILWSPKVTLPLACPEVLLLALNQKSATFLDVQGHPMENVISG